MAMRSKESHSNEERKFDSKEVQEWSRACEESPWKIGFRVFIALSPRELSQSVDEVWHCAHHPSPPDSV